MPLPSKFSPLRPLYLAAGSAMTLGVLLILIGAMYLSLVFWDGDASGQNQTLPLVIVAIAGGIITFIGLLFLVAAIFMRRRKVWAIILAMVLTSLALLIILLQVAQATFRGGLQLVPVLVLGIFAAAFGQMLWHLIRGWSALRNAPDAVRGFTPLMAQPVQPVEGHDA